MNQAPGFEVLKRIAADLGKDLDWIVPQVDALRPERNRGHFLHDLVENNPVALNELPNVNERTVNMWAVQVGINPAEVRDRCQAIHQRRQRKAKARAARQARKQQGKKQADANPQGGNVV